MYLFDEGQRHHHDVRHGELPGRTETDRKRIKRELLGHLSACPDCKITDRVDGCEEFKRLERRWAGMCMTHVKQETGHECDR